MSFKFFSDRIKLSEVSPEEALRAAASATPKEVPSLDDLLARIDSENKQTKTASSESVTKTAKTAPAASQDASKVEVKVSPDLAKEASKVATACVCTKKGDCNCGPECKDCDCGKEAEKACNASASAKKSVKIAMKQEIDFRNWEAEDVVKAWDQHGSFASCEKNVGNLTNNPRLYCGLLQEASKLAKGKIKTASSEKKASDDKSSDKKAWKRLAKLTDQERSMLDKYWRKLYGDYYVDAMLSDY